MSQLNIMPVYPSQVNDTFKNMYSGNESIMDCYRKPYPVDPVSYSKLENNMMNQCYDMEAYKRYLTNQFQMSSAKIE